MDRINAGGVVVFVSMAVAATGCPSAAMPAMTEAASAGIAPGGAQSQNASAWTAKQMSMVREAIDFRLFLIREASARDSETKDAGPVAGCEEALSAVSQAEMMECVRVLEARNLLCGGGGAFGDKPNDVINDLIAAGSSHEWNEAAFKDWHTRLHGFAVKTGRPLLQKVVGSREWPTPEHGPVEWVRGILDECFNKVAAPPEPTVAFPKEQ